MTELYGKQYYSNLIADDIQVHLVRVLLRQDMNNQIWKTISSEISVKPTYNKEWITEYTEYKLHFEENWLKRLDMEYRCQR